LMYISEAERLDKEISESWKEGMGDIVTFVSFDISSYCCEMRVTQVILKALATARR